ncbi:hypothetical protein HQ489_00860 [Candidatus Woesearchaeota archaeon]|nr:hypothetical protein [Candidatus Woesearchaeota archaeon]
MKHTQRLSKLGKDILILGTLGLIGYGIYEVGFASKNIQNSVVEEIGDYRAYIDLENPSLDETHHYIKIDNHSRCLDLGDYNSQHIVKKDQFSVITYTPKIFQRCDEIIYLQK